ncbi:hypothetical protein Cni_G22445 [Canna indica]|uniref:SWIM-type domain-containing protein n=1 Tax=Canna indica TaxID=4628 RepID=A0AAQ3KU74_9LILI|nr:hypothetical protein Cni_G22445 [Canna indica]
MASQTQLGFIDIDIQHSERDGKSNTNTVPTRDNVAGEEEGVHSEGMLSLVNQMMNGKLFRTIQYRKGLKFRGLRMRRLELQLGVLLIYGCTWHIHASPTPDGVTYKIKTYNLDHNCIRTTRNSNASSTWIAKSLQSKLVADPEMSYCRMKAELLKKYGLEPTNNMQLYRARRRVKEENQGNHAKSYDKLLAWAKLSRVTNPGSMVKMEVDARMFANPLFMRFFVCFDAMIKGFVRGCRPWFEIDGCHLKGTYGGVLLSAVAIDGNKGMFPIAYAVVEVECTDSWKFFLRLLYESLASIRECKDHPLTKMSGMQKGLGSAVSEFFPYAKHRIMGRLQRRFEKGSRFEFVTTPRIWKIVDMTMQDVKLCKVIDAGDDEFQVRDGFTTFAVNLRTKSCGCNYWSLCGLPCTHACACISYKRYNVERFYDHYYSNEMYCKTYQEMIHPMPELDERDRDGYPTIDPPKLKRLLGRPRTARRRATNEGRAGQQDARRSCIVRCGICKEFRHNRKGCQRGKTAKEKKKEALAFAVDQAQSGANTEGVTQASIGTSTQDDGNVEGHLGDANANEIPTQASNSTSRKGAVHMPTTTQPSQTLQREPHAKRKKIQPRRATQQGPVLDL